jgi:aminopeptidase N
VQGSETRTGGRAVRRFLAPRVRDFAWAAGSLQSIQATTSTGVRVRVSYPPAVPRDAALHTLGIARSAMERYAAFLGSYPYPEVDVVIGTFQTFGGMEYPGLVMTLLAEAPVAHELAHQWWYGMVGDDEYGAPWLDEAFATWTQGWFSGTNSTLCDGTAWLSPEDRVTNDMGFWRLHPRAYGATVYHQGACALQSLDVLMGDSAFTAFLGRYARAHRFGWSTTAAFEAAVQAADPGTGLRGFWAEHRIG